MDALEEKRRELSDKIRALRILKELEPENDQHQADLSLVMGEAMRNVQEILKAKKAKKVGN